MIKIINRPVTSRESGMKSVNFFMTGQLAFPQLNLLVQYKEQGVIVMLKF
jgi:hypothetical protein